MIDLRRPRLPPLEAEGEKSMWIFFVLVGPSLPAGSDWLELYTRTLHRTYWLLSSIWF
jgi:hypothetical protein